MIVASPRSASAARSPDQDRRATRSPHSSSPATAPQSCSVDACLAIGGIFYVLSVRSAILAVGCAVATALLFGALAALFTPWGPLRAQLDPGVARAVAGSVLEQVVEERAQPGFVAAHVHAVAEELERQAYWPVNGGGPNHDANRRSRAAQAPARTPPLATHPTPRMATNTNRWISRRC